MFLPAKVFFFHGEGRGQSQPEKFRNSEIHRVRLSEIPSNKIPAFTFHKFNSWYIPMALLNSVMWEESSFSGQIKTWGCVLDLQSKGNLEMGWGRQRKLQGEGGKRKKEQEQSPG